MPMSIALSNGYLKTHWDAMSSKEPTPLVGMLLVANGVSRVKCTWQKRIKKPKTKPSMVCSAVSMMNIYCHCSNRLALPSLFKHHPEVPDSDVDDRLFGRVRVAGRFTRDGDRTSWEIWSMTTGGFGCLAGTDL